MLLPTQWLLFGSRLRCACASSSKAGKPSAASGDPELTSQPRGTPLAAFILRIPRFRVQKWSFWFRNGVGFVVWLPRRYKRSIFFPRSWVPRELCVFSVVKFKIPHYRAQEELEILRAGQFERVSWPCPWIIPLTNALCAQRPVRRRYFVPRSIGAGINRILLFPRTDDSLTA